MTTAKTRRRSPLTERAASALEARGIDLELAARFGLESFQPRDRADTREWIAIPHLRGGQEIHAEYRTVTGEKAFRQTPEKQGGQRCFWNEDVLDDSSLHGQSLVITEGKLDGLVVVGVGIVPVVSICDGAPDPKHRAEDPRKKYDYVLARLEQIRKFRDVVLATDNDDPGALLLNDLARIIGRGRCRWVDFGPGCKDANDVLVRHGAEALVAAIHGAAPVHLPGVYRLSELPPAPDYPAYRAGINGIDDLWCFRPGELSVLLGVPASGKSTLLNQIAVAVGQQHDWVTAWWSPEQPARTTHVRRLMHLKLGKPSNIWKPDEVEQARQWVEHHNVWLLEVDDEDPTIEWLLARIDDVVLRYNAKLLVVDPWNELLHAWEPGIREDQYLGFWLKQLNRKARDCGIHIVTAVHPHALRRDGQKELPPPGPYNISGGSMWYNKACVGVTIHPAGDNKTKLINWKAKFRDEKNYAQLGERSFAYNGFTNQLSQTLEVDCE